MRLFSHVFVSMHMNMYSCVNMYADLYSDDIRMYAYADLHACLCICMFVCIHTHMYTDESTCVPVLVQECAYVFVLKCESNKLKLFDCFCCLGGLSLEGIQP